MLIYGDDSEQRIYDHSPIAGIGAPQANRLTDAQPMLQTLHLISAPMVRSTRLRPARPDCPSCGPNATIGLSVDTATGERKADLSQVDYVAFCAGAGGDGDDWADYQEDGEGGDRMTRSGMTGNAERIGVRELQRMMGAQRPTIDGQQGREVEDDQRTGTRGVRLIDTRSATEFGICAIPGSISEFCFACCETVGKWFCRLVMRAYFSA